VYGGIVEEWIKLANSLKLRMAMRIVNVDEAFAREKALEVVGHPVGPMLSNADNALVTVEKSPFYVVLYEYNEGDSHISADILSYMNGYEDPRRSKYFKKSTFSLEGITNDYIGLRSGVNVDNATCKSYSNANLATDTKLMWMNAAETAFLYAEGALRGWNMGGSAEYYYSKGIQLSFEQWGASGATAYEDDEVRRPKRHEDPVNPSYSYRSGDVSSVTVKWDTNASSEENLERIITQKWIANFPNGIEAWSEYRRTGYPRLMPVIENLSGGKVNSARMARRLVYPQSEYVNNGENLNEALTNYLGGPDTMGTDVWWAKKN
jgi:hypothetical protein